MVELVHCLRKFKIGPLPKCVLRLSKDNIYWNETKTLLLRKSLIIGTQPQIDLIQEV